MTSTEASSATHRTKNRKTFFFMFSSCFEWISPDHHSVCDTPFSWQSMPLRRDVYCFVVSEGLRECRHRGRGEHGARKVGGTDSSWDEQSCQQQE